MLQLVLPAAILCIVGFCVLFVGMALRSSSFIGQLVIKTILSICLTIILDLCRRRIVDILDDECQRWRSELARFKIFYKWLRLKQTRSLSLFIYVCVCVCGLCDTHLLVSSCCEGWSWVFWPSSFWSFEMCHKQRKDLRETTFSWITALLIKLQSMTCFILIFEG